MSAAAGLNAFIPMLILGLLDRYTDLVQLPAEWAWLGNGWVLLIVGLALPLLVFIALFACVRVIAATEVPEDVTSTRGAPRPRSLVGRFRAWLTSTPKKLDYRRDRRGRFRRVRRS